MSDPYLGLSGLIPLSREHLWRGGTDEQMQCWCKPFTAPFLIAAHRPDPGYVFWEYGEQGPMADGAFVTWDGMPLIYRDMMS